MPSFASPSDPEFSGTRFKYMPIADESGTEKNLPLSKAHRFLRHVNFPDRRMWEPILYFVLVSFSLGMIALITFGATYENPASSSSHVQVAPCGSNPQEARARGCHFDIISFAWLPDACYDKELSDGFDDMAEWKWWLDPNATQPVSHAEAMTGEHTGLYVNWEYHLRHCTAMWKKLHRALLGDGKRAIDSYVGPIQHTEHCEKMLLRPRGIGFEDINTIILVKYPDCGIE